MTSPKVYDKLPIWTQSAYNLEVKSSLVGHRPDILQGRKSGRVG